MRGKLITIFGATGFLGQYLVPKLLSAGAIVRLAVRNLDQAQELKIVRQVGNLEFVSVNLSNEQSITNVIEDSDFVINLIGILFESGRHTFDLVHTQYSKNIATACHGKKLIYVTAIGADPHSNSSYLSSKGRGELEALKANPNTTIIRPSIIFGAEDKFFNKFAEMSIQSPFLPLIGGGNMKLQPVYVMDVVQAIFNVIHEHQPLNDPHAGKIYELGGPSVYTFKELMQFILNSIQKKRMLLNIPYPLALLMGSIMQYLPSPVLTRDQVRLTKYDNVVSTEALSFTDLKIPPVAIEAIVPLYLKRYTAHR